MSITVQFHGQAYIVTEANVIQFCAWIASQKVAA